MIKKILLNIFVLIFLFFILDIFIFYNQAMKYVSNPDINKIKSVYISNIFKKISQEIPITDTSVEKYNKDIREQSIIFAGCSFMKGIGLKEKETLPYLLSEIIKRPVINFGLPQGGLSQLLYAVENNILYRHIKKLHSNKNPALILYIYSDFHIQRLLMQCLFLEKSIVLYRIQNKKLVLKNPPFLITRFALLSWINERIFKYLEKNCNYYRNYLKKLLLIHFVQIKNNLKIKYPNMKFVILVYFPSPIFEEISNELANEGFYILRMDKDFNKNTYSIEYKLPDGHPSSLIWEEIKQPLAQNLEKIIRL